MGSIIVQNLRAVFCMVTAWLILLLVASEQKAMDNKEEEAKQVALTADIAKKTLLEMARKQIPPGVIIPAPKDVPIVVLNADEIAVGIWKCNPGKKTFEATACYPDAPQHKFNHVTGVFQRTKEGKWIAKITQSESGG